VRLAVSRTTRTGPSRAGAAGLRHAAVLVLAGLALASSALAAPRAGDLLVASPSLQDPNFYRTVVLLLHHDAEGSVGLVLNQESDLNPATLLTEVIGLDRYQGRVFIGGPVDLRHVSVLSSSDAAGQAVLDGVYLSNDARALEALVASGNLDTSTLRIFVGYAGWSAGQLVQEIGAGAWRLQPASASRVFDDPANLWPALNRRDGLLRVQGQSAHPPLLPPAAWCAAGGEDAGLGRGAMASLLAAR
jgi:putative transcriptional regulator